MATVTQHPRHRDSEISANVIGDAQQVGPKHAWIEGLESRATPCADVLFNAGPHHVVKRHHLFAVS